MKIQLKNVMIMKKVNMVLRGTLLSCLVVAASFLLTGCTQDYPKVLPSDCAAIMKVDVAAIAEKAGLEDNSSVSDIKEKFLEAADKEMSHKSTERLKEMLDDPAQFGVDLREPIYFFAPSKSFGYIGMVAKVLNRADLQEFVEMMLKESDSGRLKEYEECWIWTPEHNNIALAFNDNSLIIANGVMGDADARRDIRKRFSAEAEEESILEVEGFKRLAESKDDIAACLMMEGVMKLVPKRQLAEMKKLTKDYPLDEMSLVAGLNFGDETIDAYMEYIAETDEAQKQLDEMKGLMQEVTCRYWDMIPDNAFLLAGGGLHGVKYWDKIKGMKALDPLFGEMPEARDLMKQLFTTAEGEAAFAMCLPEAGANMPDMCGFMGISSKSGAEKLLDWGVEKFGTDQSYGYDEMIGDWGYRTVTVFQKDPASGRYFYNLRPLSDTPQYCILGATNDYFYFSLDEGFTPGKKPAKSVAGREYADRVKGNYSYFILDFEKLLSNEEIQENLNRTPLSDYADRFSTFEAYVNTDLRVSAQMRFRNLSKKETPLRVLSELALEAIDKQMR